MLYEVITCQPQKLADRQNFDKDWKFMLGDDSLAFQPGYDDGSWRKLNVPHDWSIEGEFSADAPSTTEGGALPTGIGWYRKSFRFVITSYSIHYTKLYDDRHLVQQFLWSRN